MTRLIFAPNLCQIINASAALIQADLVRGRRDSNDVLVVHGPVIRHVAKEMIEEAARRVWHWHAIIWADDVLVSHFPTRRFAGIAASILHRRLGGEADEVWISKLTMPSTKLVLYAYPRARVVLFEDGAEEYIPQAVTCGSDRLRRMPLSCLPGAIRREVSHWNRRPQCMDLTGICSRDRARVSVFYSLMGSCFALPDALRDVDVQPVEMKSLRSRFEALKLMFDESLCAPPEKQTERPVVFFLPQPFADLFLTEADEYALYRSAVSLIIQRGYAVWWKDHPRDGTSLAPRLQEELGAERVGIIKTDRRIPVECLVAGWELAAIASVSSSSLIYLNAWCGYPMYTAAGMIEPDKWLASADRELAAMFARHVPGLEELPGA